MSRANYKRWQNKDAEDEGPRVASAATLDARAEVAGRRVVSAPAGQLGAKATFRQRGGGDSKSTLNARSGSTANAKRLSAAIAT